MITPAKIIVPCVAVLVGMFAWEAVKPRGVVMPSAVGITSDGLLHFVDHDDKRYCNALTVTSHADFVPSEEPGRLFLEPNKVASVVFDPSCARYVWPNATVEVLTEPYRTPPR